MLNFKINCLLLGDWSQHHMTKQWAWWEEYWSNGEDTEWICAKNCKRRPILKNRWFKVSLTKFLNLYDAKTLYRYGKVYYLSRHNSLDKDMNVFWVRALLQTTCYSRVVNSLPSKLMYMVLRLEGHEKDHLKFTKI